MIMDSIDISCTKCGGVLSPDHSCPSAECNEDSVPFLDKIAKESESCNEACHASTSGSDFGTIYIEKYRKNSSEENDVESESPLMQSPRKHALISGGNLSISPPSNETFIEENPNDLYREDLALDTNEKNVPEFLPIVSTEMSPEESVFKFEQCGNPLDNLFECFDTNVLSSLHQEDDEMQSDIFSGASESPIIKHSRSQSEKPYIKSSNQGNEETQSSIRAGPSKSVSSDQSSSKSTIKSSNKDNDEKQSGVVVGSSKSQRKTRARSKTSIKSSNQGDDIKQNAGPSNFFSSVQPIPKSSIKSSNRTAEEKQCGVRAGPSKVDRSGHYNKSIKSPTKFSSQGDDDKLSGIRTDPSETYGSEHHRSIFEKFPIKPSSKKTFTCKQCGAILSSKTNLNRHQDLHKEKRFTCEICKHKFARKDNLRTHFRNHSGVRPFQCTECSKRFNSKHHLNRHFRRHTGERPFVCAICGRSFITTYSLGRHLDTHTKK